MMTGEKVPTELGNLIPPMTKERAGSVPDYKFLIIRYCIIEIIYQFVDFFIIYCGME